MSNLVRTATTDVVPHVLDGELVADQPTRDPNSLATDDILADLREMWATHGDAPEVRDLIPDPEWTIAERQQLALEEIRTNHMYGWTG